jgi:hypothetical protein
MVIPQTCGYHLHSILKMTDFVAQYLAIAPYLLMPPRACSTTIRSELMQRLLARDSGLSGRFFVAFCGINKLGCLMPRKPEPAIAATSIGILFIK